MEACAEKIPHLLIKFFEDRRVGLINEAESHEDNEMDKEYLKTKGFESGDDDEEEEKEEPGQEAKGGIAKTGT
jgi:hypothetical protein